MLALGGLDTLRQFTALTATKGLPGLKRGQYLPRTTAWFLGECGAVVREMNLDGNKPGR